MNPGTFIINGNIVRPEEKVKLLGVHIDNELHFGYHVSHICQKAGKQLSRVHNESNKLLLYSSFTSCYFNYCCVLWHFCNNFDTLTIEKLQENFYDILCLISKVHISSCCITVENLLYFYNDCKSCWKSFTGYYMDCIRRT